LSGTLITQPRIRIRSTVAIEAEVEVEAETGAARAALPRASR
jgi:hypothetical protein